MGFDASSCDSDDGGIESLLGLNLGFMSDCFDVVMENL